MFDLRPYSRKNHMTAYNPFRELEEMERHFFDDPFDFFEGGSLAEFKTDIIDNGDSYTLETDLPGFQKGDINLDITDDVLTIKAERHSEHEKKDKKDKYVRCERAYGSYSRSFNISEVDADRISAKYEDGVLRLTLPKKEQPKTASRKLEIE